MAKPDPLHDLAAERVIQAVDRLAYYWLLNLAVNNADAKLTKAAQLIIEYLDEVENDD